MSIEKVILRRHGKGNGWAGWQSDVGTKLYGIHSKGLDEGILKIELNRPQSVLMKICVALIRRGSYGGRHARNSF